MNTFIKIVVIIAVLALVFGLFAPLIYSIATQSSNSNSSQLENLNIESGANLEIE